MLQAAESFQEPWRGSTRVRPNSKACVEISPEALGGRATHRFDPDWKTRQTNLVPAQLTTIPNSPNADGN